jgi:hypothetical protein
MMVEIAGSDLFLPISLSLIAFGSFGWGLRGHFVTTGRIPHGMRLLSIASLASYLTFVGLLFWHGCEAAVWTTLGSVGIASSIALFWWTVTKTRLHRLRLAYTDADPDTIAGAWQWVAALGLALWYVHIARGEEKRFQSSAFALAYYNYRQRTGMLLPRLALDIKGGRPGRSQQ